MERSVAALRITGNFLTATNCSAFFDEAAARVLCAYEKYISHKKEFFGRVAGKAFEQGSATTASEDQAATTGLHQRWQANLNKLREVDDSIEIIAREMARQSKKQE